MAMEERLVLAIRDDVRVRGFLFNLIVMGIKDEQREQELAIELMADYGVPLDIVGEGTDLCLAEVENAVFEGWQPLQPPASK